MARFEYQAKGWFPLPHPNAGTEIVPRIPIVAVWRGSVEAPDINAARVMARWHCERVVGMHDVLVTKCAISILKTED